MRKQVIQVLGLVAFYILMGLTVLAQVSSGSVTGKVLDESGAAIAGATVDVTSLETSVTRTVSTNEQGAYNVPNLDPGLYNVEVKAAGFSTGSAQNVKISVSFVTPVNFELRPGATDVVVDVKASGETVQINTTDQQLSTLIDNKKIIELPLLSRDPNALILLSPGVFPSSANGGFAVNGSRDRNNNFLVDGIDNNDTEVPGIPGGVATPNIDATQEFRVITGNFNAEYGRNTGAIINVSTKNGTNEFHGSAYLYNRSDSLASRDFFDTTGKAAPLNRNQVGGTFGGAIIKNKLFFFGSYEKDLNDVGGQATRTVPSASARMGILENTPFGRLDVRPTSRNNRLGFAINPFTTQLLNAIYPMGNDTFSAQFPGTFDIFRFRFELQNRTDDVTGRVDYQLSNNNRLFVRYGFNRGEFPGVETFPGFNDGTSSLQRSSIASLNLISVITPNIVNEVRLGFNRVNAPFTGAGDGGVSTRLTDTIRMVLAQNGAQMPLNFGGTNGQGFNLGISGITSIGVFDTQKRFTGTTVIADNLTYVRSNHTFKAGFETRFVYSNSDTNFGRSETLSFNLPTLFGFPLLRDNNGQLITTAGLGGTFNNFAGFLFGLVGNQAQTQFFNQNQERVDNNFRGFRVREFDMYFQDTWRIRPNFTINYGVRYEVKGVPYEVNGLLSTLVDQDPSGFLPKGGFLFQQVGKNAPNERLQLYDDDFNNVAPRIGFAWDPFKTGKTSIRGGYGIFYDRVFGNLFTNARGNLPFEFGFTDFPATRSFDEALVQNIPRPATVMTRSNALTDDELSPVIFPQRGNNSFQKEFRNPYTQNFSLGIQRQVLSDLVVELDYVGVKGTKLLNVVDGNLTNVARKNLITGANRPVSNSLRQNFLNGTLNTAFNIAFLNLTSGFSTYHALTLRVTKLINSPRFGFGQIQGAYTYSHSIDNTEDPLSPTDTNRSLPRDSSGFAGGSSAERGDSGNDSRNRFVMNFVYEFPFKAENRILNALISRFTIGGIVTAQSGNPFSVFFNGLDTQGTGVSARARFAPDGVAGITPSRNLNPRLQTGPLSSLFLAPSNALLDGRPGNVPRGAFVGPGFARADFNVGKKFNLGETRTATARVDFFNLFNRVNLGQPINLVNDPRFGQSLTAGQSRVIQLVFRYDF